MGVCCDIVVDPRKIPIPTLGDGLQYMSLAHAIDYVVNKFWHRLPMHDGRFALRVLRPRHNGGYPWVIRQMDDTRTVIDWTAWYGLRTPNYLSAKPERLMFFSSTTAQTIQITRGMCLIQERWSLNNWQAIRSDEERLADRDHTRYYIPWVIIRLDDLIQFLGGPSPDDYGLIWDFPNWGGLPIMADWLEEHDEYEAQAWILRALIKSVSETPTDDIPF